MKELQNLLQQIATITQKNTEILNATGGRFNMFRIAGSIIMKILILLL